MYIQCSTVNRKGKVSYNRKLVESYRDPKTKQPRVRTVQLIEGLAVAERAKIIYDHGGQKHLFAEEWQALEQMGLLGSQQAGFEVGDTYRGGGSAIALAHMKSSGMFAVLDRHLSRAASEVIRELVVEQLLYPKSKAQFSQRRRSGLMYVLGGKRDYKEDKVYLALDELTEQFEAIQAGLTETLPATSARLLLYDLSNSFFTGTKAELGGRGESKEKRHDRYIVTYGLVMNEDNMPLDLRIWKGGTADKNTVRATFAEWKQAYQADQAIWVGDRSMSDEDTLDELSQIGLNYVTGLPGNSQQAMLRLCYEEQPELFDDTDLASFTHEGSRYVLCRHQHKGYRRERKQAERRRKVYEELSAIRQSPQNKDGKKLYHRAMRALEQHDQTKFWEIEVVEIASPDKHPRYRLTFRLNRHKVLIEDTLGHYYLLQTDLDTNELTDEQVAESYKELKQVERSFRDIKTHIEVRPIRHWKARRIEAHIRLCYLSLWLSKYIENQWRHRGVTTEVTPTLTEWDEQLQLCEKVDSHGTMIELKWNRGKNARAAIQRIKYYGEMEAIKSYL